MPGDDGIPAWQRKGFNETSAAHNSREEESQKQPDSLEKSTPTTTRSDHNAPSTEGREAVRADPDQKQLLDQARLFLQDEKIRDAPVEAKIRFLEEKGVHGAALEQLRQLLEPVPATQTQIPNTASTVTTQQSPQRPPQQQPQQQPPVPRRPSSPPTTSSAERTSSPPIITYPEHLLRPTKPPPIVTTSRLINTAYAFTGLAALTYGVSTYLVQPMVESLTSSRHDFAQNTQERLDELIKKLEASVSTLPPAHSTGRHAADPAAEKDKDADADAESESNFSDPTELFHRDYGTQTDSAELSRRRDADSDSSSSLGPLADLTPQDATLLQATQLAHLREELASLGADALSTEAQGQQEMSTTVKVLNEYLEGLAFAAPSDFTSSVSYHSFGGEGTASSMWSKNGGSGREDNKDDEVEQIRQKIRSVKGVLLSARNFPMSSTAAAAAGTGTGTGTGAPTGRRGLFPVEGGSEATSQ